jgi:hypothetical protein
LIAAAELQKDDVITIENCTFAFACPQDWHELERNPADVRVRRCHVCQKNVHYCDINDELMRRVTAGQCVAVARMPSVIGREREKFTLGIVLPEQPESPAKLGVSILRPPTEVLELPPQRAPRA